MSACCQVEVNKWNHTESSDGVEELIDLVVKGCDKCIWVFVNERYSKGGRGVVSDQRIPGQKITVGL